MPLLQDAATLTLTRVATASALIAEIAKSTGQHLEVAPALRTEVLMVSVENARVGDVLAKLSIAATASWQPDGVGLRLVPDKAARGIEARTEQARRREAISAAVRKRQADAAKKKDEGDDDFGLSGAFMGNRSVDAFVPMLDLSALAAMRPGDRIVFATGANAAQVPLLGDPTSVVDDWIARHNRDAEKMAASVSAIPDGLDAILKGPIGDRMKSASRTITGSPTKIVVVVGRGAMPFMSGGGLDIRLEVRAYGKDGSVLIEQTGAVGTGMADMIAAMNVKKPDVAPATTVPIVYSPEAKALAGLSNVQSLSAGGLGGIARGPKANPELRTLLLSPTKHDPLALLPGEGLVALAKARRKPLVACLPDAAYPAVLGTAVPKTIEDVEEGLKSGPMRLVPDATFLVVKAAEPETARENRLDRAALETLLKDVADHEAPTLDELSAFALSSVPPSRNPVTMSALMLFVPSTLSSMSGMVSWDGLRLYGSLSSGQREVLAQGAKVSFSELSPTAQNAVAAMLYGAGGGLNVDRGGAPSEPDPFTTAMKMALGGGNVDAREEPTEVAPNGLPANGYLQASVTSEPIIRPLTDDGPSASSISTNELAMVRLMSGSPMASQMADAMRLPDTGRLGTRMVWNLRGYVTASAYVAATLDDDHTPKDAATVSFSNLPEEFQSRVAQRTEALKNSPLGAIISMAGMGKRSP